MSRPRWLVHAAELRRTSGRRSRGGPRDATTHRGLWADRRHPHRPPVSSAGSIDWLCVPRFDSEAVFGRLVGGPAAGCFQVGAGGPATVVSRRYRQHTATLETTWAAGGRSSTVSRRHGVRRRRPPPTGDAPRPPGDGAGRPGTVTVLFDPKLGEAHRPPRCRRRGPNVVCQWGGLALCLRCSPGVDVDPGEPTSITVTPERPLTLRWSSPIGNRSSFSTRPRAWNLVVEDEARWRAWTTGIDQRLPHREVVGAQPVDAAAADLLTLGRARRRPHHLAARGPGRRAQLGLPLRLAPRRQHRRRRLPRVGKVDEARRFLAWLLHASRLARPRLPVLLTLDGRRPRRADLRGWPGYAGSRPVRVGNGAADQHQLDGYGWVLDAAWLLDRAGHRLYRRRGGRCEASPTTSPGGGANRTPASGRFAASPPTTCTPSSWPGSLSTEPCASAHPPHCRPGRSPVGNRRATPSPPTSPLTASTPRSSQLHPHLRIATTSTPRCSSSPPRPRAARLAARPGHDRRHPPRARRRRPTALPLPARPRRPARRRRRLPALFVLARPSPRQHRPGRRGGPAVRRTSSELANPLGLCPRRSTQEPAATSATTPKPSPTPPSSRPPSPSATPTATSWPTGSPTRPPIRSRRGGAVHLCHPVKGHRRSRTSTRAADRGDGSAQLLIRS